MKSWHVIARNLASQGEVRGWIVTATSKRDAEHHAERQLREAFGGRWRALQTKRASKALLRQADPFRR